MNKKKLIEKLNEILAHEWTGFTQYQQQAFMVRGVWREVYAKRFQASADESLMHARLIGEKIVALGGVPTIERNKVQQSQTLDEMLHNSLEFESAAVKHYTEALELAEDDRALVVLLEDILLQEQDGVDELELLIRSEGSVREARPVRERVG
jgi:bacterioferritin